jgi:hypothetical protein
LDSLVRIETYQWVTRDKPPKVFLGPFVRGFGAAGTVAHNLGARRSGIAHGASLS